MDLSAIRLEDAVPLMRGIEEALSSEKVETVVLRDDSNDENLAMLTRSQAEHFLLSLEKHFFAQAN